MKPVKKVTVSLDGDLYNLLTDEEEQTIFAAVHEIEHLITEARLHVERLCERPGSTPDSHDRRAALLVLLRMVVAKKANEAECRTRYSRLNDLIDRAHASLAPHLHIR